MKYTLFGFSQKKLIELGLSLNDAAFLRWFVDFKDARKNGKAVMVSQIIDERLFYWVNYSSVREEYPILKISSNDSIYRRFKELSKKNILEHRTVKAGGTFSYFALGDKYYELISDEDEEKEELSEDEKTCIDSFNKNICKLKNVDKDEFLEICEKNNKDFILAIIDLCSKKGKSFKYFKKALKEKLAKKINTKELLDESIADFKKEMEAKKIAALKEKQDPKVPTKEEREAIKQELDNKVKLEVVENLENLEAIKEVLKKDIPEIYFKTWIEQLIIKKENAAIRIFAINEFSTDTVKKRYELNIIKALQDLKIKYEKISYEIIAQN